MQRRQFFKPKKIETAAGFCVRSKYEKTVVEALLEGASTFAYESTTLPYTVTHKYTPDITLPGDIHIEIKGGRGYGNWPSSDRTKVKAVREQNGADIRFLFEHAHTPISKTSKTTKAQWCDRHGFLWAEGRIPEAWLLN